jgi:hypothetical protein
MIPTMMTIHAHVGVEWPELVAAAATVVDVVLVLVLVAAAVVVVAGLVVGVAVVGGGDVVGGTVGGVVVGGASVVAGASVVTVVAAVTASVGRGGSVGSAGFTVVEVGVVDAGALVEPGVGALGRGKSVELAVGRLAELPPEPHAPNRTMSPTRKRIRRIINGIRNWVGCARWSRIRLSATTPRTGESGRFGVLSTKSSARDVVGR